MHKPAFQLLLSLARPTAPRAAAWRLSRGRRHTRVALAEVALHQCVHMVPPFEHCVACGRNQPTVFKLNTHA